MNIHEISEKFHISMVKLRRMQKAGVLVATGSDGHPLAFAMRQNLANHKPLSVEQLVVLIQNPDVFAELRTKQGEARAQIEALGDYVACQPSPSLFSRIVDASEGGETGILTVMDWIKKILPDHPVNHGWLGVRVAQGVKNDMGRADLIFKFTNALKIIRKRPEFEGWHRKEIIAGANRTIYFRPQREKTLANFDL